MVISKKFRVFFVAAFLFVILYLSVSMGYKLGRRQNSEADAQTKEVSALDSKHTIKQNTVINTTIIFSKCGHEIHKTDIPSQDMLGLNAIDFKERFSDYTIVNFSSKQVDLVKKVDGYCDKHFVLKLLGTRAVVYNYDIELDDFRIIKETELTVNELSSDDIAVLTRGKLFNSLHDVSFYIDSIKND